MQRLSIVKCNGLRITQKEYSPSWNSPGSRGDDTSSTNSAAESDNNMRAENDAETNTDSDTNSNELGGHRSDSNPENDGFLSTESITVLGKGSDITSGAEIDGDAKFRDHRRSSLLEIGACWSELRGTLRAEELSGVSSESEEEIVIGARRSMLSGSRSQPFRHVQSTCQEILHRSHHRGGPTSASSGVPLDLLNAPDIIDLTQEDSDNSNALNTCYELLHHSKRERRSGRSKRPSMTGVTVEVPARDSFKERLRELESANNIAKLYPRSLQPGIEQAMPPVDARECLGDFLRAEIGEKDLTSEDTEGFPEIFLSGFSIYRSIHEDTFPGQLETLQNVITKQEKIKFFFDGIVSFGSQDVYLEGIPIKEVSIGGYEPHIHTTKVWLRSEQNSGEESIWYSLRDPSSEYKSLWSKSLWLADLAKHFFDYLCAHGNRGVALNDFKSDFIQWLKVSHGNDENFCQWQEKCGKRVDFRQDIATHVDFLWHQIYNLDPGLFKAHPVWHQIRPGFDTSPLRFVVEQSVVTRNIGTGFLVAFDHWGKEKTDGTPGLDLLKIEEACPAVLAQQQERRVKLGLPNKFQVDQTPHFEKLPGKRLKSKVELTLERVIGFKAKTQASAIALVNKVVILKTLRPEYSDYEYRYALVQGSSSLGSKLRIVWLLPPSQTSCGNGHYNIGNELLLSDECNCKDEPLSNVVSAFGVSLLSDSARQGDSFFVRELFLWKGFEEDGGMFVNALQDDVDYQCACSGRKGSQPSLRRGRERHATDHKKGENKLPNMKVASLFSGCGLLDTGIESSGICETIFANDLNKHAIQSHAANQPNLKCKHVTGSVNLCLRRLLQGKDPLLQVDCVVAGCPCQGFSLRNQQHNAAHSQRNCSLLATTLSFAELYLPAYLVVENVPEMDGRGDPTACQQAVCSLVAMGYQVQKWLLVASDYGTPQSRKRLFIIGTASGFVVPEKPASTHGVRSFLKAVTASNSTSHLEQIDNDEILNIKDPSHVPVHRVGWNADGISLRSIISRIPRKRREGNLFGAWKAGRLTPQEIKWLKHQHEEKRHANSGTLRRINPNEPFKTVLTSMNVMDARASACLHWSEHRSPTLTEFRVAMGIPQDMVLVGSVRDQLKQIGNGVPVQLAFAVGQAVGAAWVASHSSNDREQHEEVPEQTIKHTFTFEICQRHTERKSKRCEDLETEIGLKSIGMDGFTQKIRSAPSTTPDSRISSRKRRGEELQDSKIRKLWKAYFASTDDDDEDDDIFVREKSVARHKEVQIRG